MQHNGMGAWENRGSDSGCISANWPKRTRPANTGTALIASSR